MACDSCLTALNYPDLTRRSYSMGCAYCAARYLEQGGESNIEKWVGYGLSLSEVYELRQRGELIDPELRKRKSK